LTQLIRRYMPKNFRKHLRRLTDVSVNAYYGWFARRLAAVATDNFTGETYLLNAQPYTVDCVLHGYALGAFALPDAHTGTSHWYDPHPRAILPLQDLQVPQHLKTLIHERGYTVRVDENFQQIVEQCLHAHKLTQHTRSYVDVWQEMHALGHAHAIGVWDKHELVGGQYGFALGGYFTTEGSFQKTSDADKVALMRLAEILAAGGFVLYDTRWLTPLITQFGGQCISRDEFHKRHVQAIVAAAQFDVHAPALFTAT
jgi:leucyl/phenylalanyl-tRNA---protein transferase